MATVSAPAKNGKAKKAPQASAAALLKAAAKTKDTAAGRGPFDYDGDLQQTAGKILTLARQKDEIEREIDLAKDDLRRSVDPWYRDRLSRNGYEPSVKVDGGKAGTLRVTYMHRYLKLVAEREESISGVVGTEVYARFFQPAASLKVRKDIAEDPERLNAVVLKLAEALGADEFSAIFEAEQTIVPTRLFTEQRYKELNAETNAALELAGVRQVVSMASQR